MSERIKQMYKNAGIKPPDGKDIHTAAFHRQAIANKKSNPSYSMSRCYSIAMANLGRDKAVHKAHRQLAKKRKTKKKR